MGLSLYALFSHAKWDWARAATREGDERQKLVADESARVAFALVLVTSLVGSVWEMYLQRFPGAFPLVGAIAGATYLVTVALLSRESREAPDVLRHQDT